MKTKITNSLEEADKDLVLSQFNTTVRIRKRLCELLEKDIDNIHLSMRESINYSNPSWGYEQAEKLGEVKALKKLISLLE